MPRPSADDHHQITMNIPPLAKARLLRAVELKGTSLEDFMLRSSLRAADEVIDQANRIALSKRDTQLVLELLDHPRQPNSNMISILRARVAE